MRKLHEAGSDRMIELFAYRIAAEAAAMVVAPGGVDGFFFTGGVGEHDPAVRRLVVDRLAWLGLSLLPNAPPKER